MHLFAVKKGKRGQGRVRRKGCSIMTSQQTKVSWITFSSPITLFWLRYHPLLNYNISMASLSSAEKRVRFDTLAITDTDATVEFDFCSSMDLDEEVKK